MHLIFAECPFKDSRCVKLTIRLRCSMMALVQSRRSVTYTCFSVASRISVESGPKIVVKPGLAIELLFPVNYY